MLDVCVALTERDDEKEQMQQLVKKLSMAVEAPLIIDTTEADVAEAALSLYPGRGIINGNNLENGRERIDSILPIANKHGAAVLSMTIDEEGMAHKREKKLGIARRITDIAVSEYGMSTDDLVFDTLTFPLTTGQGRAAQRRGGDARRHPSDQAAAPRRNDRPRHQQCQLRCRQRRPRRTEQRLPLPCGQSRPRYGDRQSRPYHTLFRDSRRSAG